VKHFCLWVTTMMWAMTIALWTVFLAAWVNGDQVVVTINQYHEKWFELLLLPVIIICGFFVIRHMIKGMKDA